MPNKDKTGPNAMGPMTGRGAGLCSGSNNKEKIFTGRGSFRGFHNRGGRRNGCRGVRHIFKGELSLPPEMDKTREQEVLRYQIKVLKNRLTFVEARLDALNEE